MSPRHNLLDRLIFPCFTCFAKVPSTEPVTALVESITLGPPRPMEIRTVCHFGKDRATIEAGVIGGTLFLWKKGPVNSSISPQGRCSAKSAEVREAASSRPRTTERKPAELHPRFSGSSKEAIENAIAHRCWVNSRRIYCSWQLSVDTSAFEERAYTSTGGSSLLITTSRFLIPSPSVGS
jgi:hypothetical protein